jgi:hypothetical protein
MIWIQLFDRFAQGHRYRPRHWGLGRRNLQFCQDVSSAIETRQLDRRTTQIDTDHLIRRHR